MRQIRLEENHGQYRRIREKTIKVYVYALYRHSQGAPRANDENTHPQYPKIRDSDQVLAEFKFGELNLHQVAQ